MDARATISELRGRVKMSNDVCRIPCDDAIKKGICRADCCRIATVPFLRELYDGPYMNAMRQREPEEELTIADIVYPSRSDCVCIYLVDDTNRCAVYSIRPQVCECYGLASECRHYDSSGRRLSEAEKNEIDYDTIESVTALHESL